jgi:hypothetical protein
VSVCERERESVSVWERERERVSEFLEAFLYVLSHM